MKTLNAMLHDDNGQGLVEYAIAVACIAVVATVAFRTLGRKVSNTLSNAAALLP
jgi:Flp pilus assembly pilin Flp